MAREVVYRRDYLLYQLVLDEGMSEYSAMEAVSALSTLYPSGWLDDIVDAKTGEFIRKEEP